MIAGAAAGFGIAKLVGSIKGQFQELDKVAKLSRTINFDAASIAGLGFAAEQNGSSVEGMNKGLSTFVRRLGEAKARGGPVLDTLKQMGINTDEFLQLKPQEQLLQFSDGLSQIPGAADKANAAYQVMGRQGQELINTLGMGRQGLQEFISEAEGLGLGFDADELAKVEAANDAVNRVKRSFSAMFGSIAVETAGMVEDFAGSIKTVLGWFSSLSAAGETSFGGIGDWWNWLQVKIAAGVTVAMTIGEFAFRNFQQVAKLAMTNMQLSAVSAFGVLSHFFSGTLPALLTWFGDNWHDVWFTAIDYSTTILINFGQNVRSIMSAVWDFIKSGGTADLELAWTPLTDGFVNAIKELPDLPDRPISELESRLRKDSKKLSAALGGDLKGEITDRLKSLKDLQDEANKPVTPKIKGLEDPGAEDEQDEQDKQATQVEVKVAGALKQGSQEAYSAIVRAMHQNTKKDTEAEKANDLLGQQNQTLEEIRDELADRPDEALLEDLG